MFTGIIEEVGRVAAVRELGGGRRLSIEAAMAPELRAEQSVCVNGVCLTVVQTRGTSFDTVAVEETLRKTSLGALPVGGAANLERAMQPTGRLDGHIVQGHVDATGTVASVEALQTSRLYRIRFDPQFAQYLIPTGSIAVDGISLTIARLGDTDFTVSIIPYTYEHTNVWAWSAGTTVNLEFDMIGKYVIRRMSLQAASAGGTGSPGRVSEAWLREQGFGR